MNNIERLYQKSKNRADFAEGYLSYLSGLLGSLDKEEIAAFVQEIENSREQESMIFVAGNGGSASTASHMVNDLGTDVLRKSEIETPIRILALTDNSALITANANDTGYENVFVNQLRLYFRPGDKFIAISASGNSPNLVNAAQWVHENGGRVLSLVGFDGGALKDLSHLAIQVKTPKGEYGPVEDIHLILNHLISCWLVLHRDTKKRVNIVVDKSTFQPEYVSKN